MIYKWMNVLVPCHIGHCQRISCSAYVMLRQRAATIRHAAPHRARSESEHPSLPLGGAAALGTPRAAADGTPGVPGGLKTSTFQRELRGSQGVGVVSNSWFDRALLSVLYMFKPSC